MGTTSFFILFFSVLALILTFSIIGGIKGNRFRKLEKFNKYKWKHTYKEVTTMGRKCEGKFVGCEVNMAFYPKGIPQNASEESLDYVVFVEYINAKGDKKTAPINEGRMSWEEAVWVKFEKKLEVMVYDEDAFVMMPAIGPNFKNNMIEKARAYKNKRKRS